VPSVADFIHEPEGGTIQSVFAEMILQHNRLACHPYGFAQKNRGIFCVVEHIDDQGRAELAVRKRQPPPIEGVTGILQSFRGRIRRRRSSNRGEAGDFGADAPVAAAYIDKSKPNGTSRLSRPPKPAPAGDGRATHEPVLRSSVRFSPTSSRSCPVPLLRGPQES